MNAAIGIAREHCSLNANGLDDMLKEIQSRLFDLGAAVATPVQTSSVRKKAYTEVQKHINLPIPHLFGLIQMIVRRYVAFLIILDIFHECFLLHINFHCLPYLPFT